MNANGWVTRAEERARRRAGVEALAGNHSAPGKAACLFLLNSLTTGGSEKKIVHLTNTLCEQGTVAHIAYINGPDSLRGLLDKDVPVIALRRRGKFSVSALVRLVRHVATHEIERIITVNLHPLVYAFLASRLLHPKREIIALVNTTVHGSRRNQRFMHLYAPLLRRAERVVFGSQQQLQVWTRDYNLNPQRCVCIHNGVDTGYFVPPFHSSLRDAWRTRLGIHPRDVVVGTVGMMRPEKGHKDLLAAAGRLRRSGITLTVLLVGDGPCRAELERYAEQAGVSAATIFYGRTDDVRPLLDVMDIFVISSLAVETFSNAALEAMAAGKAVVLSDLGGAREMITPGESGMLYKPGDVEGLVHAVRTLCEHTELRECLGSNARTRAIEEFSVERMLDDYQRWVLGPGVRVATS